MPGFTSVEKRPSSKRRKPKKDNVQAEVLHKLGLDAFWNAPLDPPSMLDISTWNLDNRAPLDSKDLPRVFLRRLWLLSQDARSPTCKPSSDALTSSDISPETLNGEDSQPTINPLDLVSAVFMSANTFLQQEITEHMVQCQFAVPLVLPSIDTKEASRFLLWPLRGVVSRWTSQFLEKNGKVQEGNLASTYMPMVSCVKLGCCNISKSKVLNHIISGPKSCNDTFLHRGMEGGQLPRRLSNGLVEIGWYLPTGDMANDGFPVPVAISNLRGDASNHEKCLALLCQVSSATIVFCGSLREKEKQLLASCKDMASKLILIDISDTEKNEHSVVGFVGVNLEQDIRLPQGSVLQGAGLSEEELANILTKTLKDLLPDKLKHITLEAAASVAVELGLNVDEGAVCKKAMAKMEKVLKGLDEGAAKFREKQLPLQGHWWCTLAEIEKTESKLKKEGKQNDPRLQQEKRDILAELKSYKMTPAMTTFTDALFTTDKVERTYFLNWMKQRLQSKQTKKQNIQRDPSTKLQTDTRNGMLDYSDYLTQGASGNLEDSDSFCSDLTFEVESEEQPVNFEPQVSDQPCDNGQDVSSYEDIEPHSVIEEQLYLMLNGKEVLGGENLSMYSFDEQHHLESQENGASNSLLSLQYEPESTPTTPDSNSSNEREMCQDISVETQVAWCLQTSEPEPFLLGLEHFLREMGLIFELTHIGPSSRSLKVSRLPSLAVDLLFYGIPLELMDGDASNIPIRWLSSIFAELKRRLPRKQCKIRVLTNLGVHRAKNSQVLYTLFGVKFPDGSKSSTRGVYMGALYLPDTLRLEMGCDFLLLIDVQGLCPVSQDNKTKVHDSEMATVAMGLSNVLIQNIASGDGSELETDIAFFVNALLHIKDCGSMPNCQLLVQDDRINTLLQASQLKRVSEMLQTEAGYRRTTNSEKTISCITCVKGPWSKSPPSEPANTQYSDAVLILKKNLFEALKKSAATSLSEFMLHLSAIWDAVKEESFTTGLQNTGTVLAFSILCTELSQWETSFLEHMENWFLGAGEKIFATKENALDAAIQNDLLSELKDEGKREVNTEMNKLRSKVEEYLMKDDVLKERAEIFKPILMNNIDDLRDRVTRDITQRLVTVGESHCSSVQVKKFETLLEKEQESKLHTLVENSISTKLLLQDEKLEEEFEGMWSNILSSFDFRPSETDDITARVREVLRLNLISQGLLKHIQKIEVIGQSETSRFQVHDEHFGYRSRLKHMFEDNNQLQRLEAQQVACSVIDKYNHFVVEKSLLPADFSDSYIIEILGNVEQALKEKSMKIKSSFEVDLKVYLCSLACQDFQKVHDRFAKDTELLTFITATKSSYLSKFIYLFRKRDQCQRVAQAFTSMIIKPTALDYIYKPLGMLIVEEIQAKEQQYQSPCAFSQHLLEELIKKDHFESLREYLLSHDSYRLSKIQETVVAHLSESPNLDKWRQQRLGEIVGRIAAAVSETAEGTNGVLSDTKPLLERVCLILESDGNVDVTRACLDGPLFSITTEWDRFVTCLMELLAAMRLELAREFSESVDVTQLLNCLPIQPHHTLFDKMRGCEKQCPHCRAPCEVQENGHGRHSTLLHRPKGLLPSDLCPVSSCPESMILSNPDQNNGTQDPFVECKDLLSLRPDWSNYPEDPGSQMPNAYWRYVLVRYKDKFAKEYQGEPANIPEEWKKITEEEALDGLKEAYLTKQS